MQLVKQNSIQGCKARVCWGVERAREKGARLSACLRFYFSAPPHARTHTVAPLLSP